MSHFGLFNNNYSISPDSIVTTAPMGASNVIPGAILMVPPFLKMSVHPGTNTKLAARIVPPSTIDNGSMTIIILRRNALLFFINKRFC